MFMLTLYQNQDYMKNPYLRNFSFGQSQRFNHNTKYTLITQISTSLGAHRKHKTTLSILLIKNTKMSHSIPPSIC